LFDINRSSYRYLLANPTKIVPERIRLISQMKRWLVNKLMTQEGLVSDKCQHTSMLRVKKNTYQYPMCSTETLALQRLIIRGVVMSLTFGR